MKELLLWNKLIILNWIWSFKLFARELNDAVANVTHSN